MLLLLQAAYWVLDLPHTLTAHPYPLGVAHAAALFLLATQWILDTNAYIMRNNMIGKLETPLPMQKSNLFRLTFLPNSIILQLLSTAVEHKFITYTWVISTNQGLSEYNWGETYYRSYLFAVFSI
jgi:hypothetical protein